jgi:hypothetical protein
MTSRTKLLTGPVEVVEAIDRDAFAANADARAGDFRLFKELVFLGFTTSESAKPTYLANPGAYHGDLTRSEYDAMVRAHG